jgi:hypothetical protein
MAAEMIPAALPEGLELTETVTHEPDNQAADRDKENCGQAAHCVLNRQPYDISLIHIQDPVPGTLIIHPHPGPLPSRAREIRVRGFFRLLSS